MTQMVLDLPAEVHEQLRLLALRQGKRSQDIAREVLAKHVLNPPPMDDRERAIVALRDAGLLREFSAEEQQRAIEENDTTLEEVQADLDSVGGKPLSEVIIEMRGPKV